MITEKSEFSVISGKPTEEVHHLVYGYGMRDLADRYGLTAPLTSNEHRFIHDAFVAGRMSKIIGQLAFEKEFYRSRRHDAGIDPARDEFRRIFGISYI